MIMKLWAARDINETIWLFFDEPILKHGYWWGTYVYTGADEPGSDRHKDILPEITFENSPQEVEITLVKKHT